MNKKEFLKSINNIDDKFLREGEEFFTPVEAEENITLYRKKRSCIKPLISAAACCAVVVAAAVVMVNVNVNGNLPVNTPADAENNSVFLSKTMNSSSISMAGEGTDNTFSISDPQKIEISLNYADLAIEKPETVRFYFLADGEPQSFSTDDKVGVYHYDKTFSPGSEKEITVSRKVDKTNRNITVVGVINPTTPESENSGILCESFINTACTEVPFIDISDDPYFPYDEIMPISNYEKGEFSAPETFEFIKNEKGVSAKMKFRNVTMLSCIVIFVNGEPMPCFGGEYAGMINYMGVASSELEAHIPNKFVHSGDTVQALVLDEVKGEWYISDKAVVE